MIEKYEFIPIRRILVPLDNSPESLAVVELAACMASVMRSELSALFIEEQELFTLAKLPFSREVSIVHSTVRNLDSGRLEREMREQAATMQKTVARIALRHQIGWSFKTVRGKRETEIATQAKARDLIAVSRGHRPDKSRSEPDAGIEFQSGRGGSGVLLINDSLSFRKGPVTVLFDGSAASIQALQLAANIAHADAMQLQILVQEDDAATLEKRRQLFHDVLDKRPLPGPRLVTGVEVPAAIQSLFHRERGLVVLAAGVSMLYEQQFEILLKRARCPVILLKSAG